DVPPAERSSYTSYDDNCCNTYIRLGAFMVLFITRSTWYVRSTRYLNSSMNTPPVDSRQQQAVLLDVLTLSAFKPQTCFSCLRVLYLWQLLQSILNGFLLIVIKSSL
ncbi:unnamed protein product, partial [Laminaria digitata]